MLTLDLVRKESCQRYLFNSLAMRMTPQEAEAIRLIAHRYFGQDAEVWLFGSRADNKKKGGDYDFPEQVF